MELVELHVGDPTSRPPGHRDAVPGRAVGIARVEVHLGRAACGEDHEGGGEHIHPAVLLVVHVGADAAVVPLDRTLSGQVRELVGRHEIDRDVTLKQLNGRPLLGLPQHVGRNGVAGRVRHVQYATERMTALLGQMEAAIFLVEGDTPTNELLDGLPGMADDVPHGPLAAQACTRTQCVLDVLVFAVRRIGDRGDSTLRPVRRARVEIAFGEHGHRCVRRQMQCRGETGGAAADDEHIVTITPSHLSLRREKRASITSASSAEYAAQSDPDIRVIDADGSDPAPQNNSSGAIFDTDQELVRRVQKGDKRAFDLLVRRYQHKIHGLVSRFIRSPDEIDDVVQESFIKAYRALPRFRGDSAFYTWVYRIAINTAKNHLVARSRRPPDVDVEVSDAEFIESADQLRDSESPESALARDQLERTIDDAIRALPEDLRSAVTLREFDGLSYEQIAAIMECPVGTVRSRIFRAREAIDKRIKPLLSRR